MVLLALGLVLEAHSKVRVEDPVPTPKPPSPAAAEPQCLHWSQSLLHLPRTRRARDLPGLAPRMILGSIKPFSSRWPRTWGWKCTR